MSERAGGRVLGRVVARTLTAGLLLAAAVVAVRGPLLVALLLVLAAAAAPIGRWHARNDADLRGAGGEHRDHPSGFGPFGNGF